MGLPGELRIFWNFSFFRLSTMVISRNEKNSVFDGFPLPVFLCLFASFFFLLIFSHFFCSPVFLPAFYLFFLVWQFFFWQYCSQPGLADFLPFIVMCFWRQMFVTDFEHFCLGFYYGFFVLPLFASLLPVFLTELPIFWAFFGYLSSPVFWQFFFLVCQFFLLWN